MSSSTAAQSMSKESFTLRPMTEQDIPTCASIAHEAFLPDRQTQFKAANPTNPYNHEEGTKSQLQHLFSRPKGSIDLIVAEDNDSHEILGWIGWGYRGFDPLAREREMTQSRENPASIPIQKPRPPPRPKPSDPRTADSSDRDRLERHTSTNMTAWMSCLMPPGTKCMYVVSIVVAPAFQGRGIGAALLRYGTAIADAEDVFCWVHASEAGAAGLGNAGFGEIGRLEVELDEWNSQGVEPPSSLSSMSSRLSGGGSMDEEAVGDAQDMSEMREAWGRYTFRYMRREPLRPA